MLVSQSCLTLCNPMDYSPTGSSVHGILQAKNKSGLPFPYQGIFWPRDRTWVSRIADRFFTIWATRGFVFRSKIFPCEVEDEVISYLALPQKWNQLLTVGSGNSRWGGGGQYSVKRALMSFPPSVSFNRKEMIVPRNVHMEISGTQTGLLR